MAQGRGDTRVCYVGLGALCSVQIKHTTPGADESSHAVRGVRGTMALGCCAALHRNGASTPTCMAAWTSGLADSAVPSPPSLTLYPPIIPVHHCPFLPSLALPIPFPPPPPRQSGVEALMPKMSMNPFCEIALEVGRGPWRMGGGPAGRGTIPRGTPRTSQGTAGQLQYHQLRGTEHCVCRVGLHHYHHMTAVRGAAAVQLHLRPSPG